MEIYIRTRSLSNETRHHKMCCCTPRIVRVYLASATSPDVWQTKLKRFPLLLSAEMKRQTRVDGVARRGKRNKMKWLLFESRLGGSPRDLLVRQNSRSGFYCSCTRANNDKCMRMRERRLS